MSESTSEKYIKEIKTLQFCFDELLGELGWGDEIEQTGVDPLAWARNEIKDLHKTIKRLRGSLELRNAAQQSRALDAANVCRVINHFYVEGVCSQCGSKEPPRQ